MSTQVYQDKPNGPVAAALLAAGIGSTVFGIATTAIERVAAFSAPMNLYAPVGPLSGKLLIGLIGYVVAWVVLNALWRGKEVEFKRITTIAFVLLAIGTLLTFPPVFDLFPAIK